MYEMSTRAIDCYESVAKVKEGHAGAYNSSLLDTATMELFLAKNT